MDGQKQRRGFALFAPDRLREISSRGGKAAHEQGTAHEYTIEEARENGRKGGLESARRRRERATAGQRS